MDQRLLRPVIKSSGKFFSTYVIILLAVTAISAEGASHPKEMGTNSRGHLIRLNKSNTINGQDTHTRKSTPRMHVRVRNFDQRHRLYSTQQSAYSFSEQGLESSNYASTSSVSIHEFSVYRCNNHSQLTTYVTSEPSVIALSKNHTSVRKPLSCTVNLVAEKDNVIYMVRKKRRHELSKGSPKNSYVITGSYDQPISVNDTSADTTECFSSNNTLKILISVEEPPALSVVTVQAVSKSLEKGMAASFMGFVQTPGYTSGTSYPPDMDSWVRIPVPRDHVTLISFLYIYTFDYFHLRCPGRLSAYFTYVLRLYSGENSTAHLVWSVCRSGKTPLPDVHDSPAFFVHFSTGRQEFYFGPTFKLLYSFHKQSNKPSRTHGGLWNCSVPEWLKFQRHFRCNLEQECDGREDEATCFHSALCGQGRLTLNDRCYLFIITNGTNVISWRDSNLECQKRDGYLASLNKPGEWQAVVAALKRRRTPRDVFIGLHDAPSVLPLMYRHTAMWADKSMAYFNSVAKQSGRCSIFKDGRYHQLHQQVRCDEKEVTTVDFLCEWDLRSPDQNIGSKIHMPVLQNSSLAIRTIKCPDGHVTHAFLACDDQSTCWSRRGEGRGRSEARWIPSRLSCPAPMTSLPAMFACGGSGSSQRVAYSMVCDHRKQCADGSDEIFCVFAQCSGSTPLQCATSKQCVSQEAFCNNQGDCELDSDETQCYFHMAETFETLPPPAVIDFNPLSSEGTELRYPDIRPMPQSGPRASEAVRCPETHFQCPDIGYCLPVFVRCNGVNDCPGREDEEGCGGAGVSCPGFYRCRSSSVCLHPSHVCDGVFQCPEHEDELFCHLECPAKCTCHALSFMCHQPFSAELYPGIRYLDASGSGLTLLHFRNNSFLIHLSLSRCGLDTLHNITFPNLRTADLSRNKVHTLSPYHLLGMRSLQYLSLSANPLKTLLSPDTEEFSLLEMRAVDVSGVSMKRLNTRIFSPFPNLESLNMSNCGIDHSAGGFHATSKLQILDIVGCPMTNFARDLLSGLNQLQAVYADNFKLCCPDTLPAGFNPASCRAPFDEVSSCDSLLRSDIYRVFLAVFSSLASVGNLGCFVLRSFVLRSSASGFGAFVTHLSVSDFLMGVYLAVIGIADRLYRGSYLWEDVSWRRSAACGVAGFLSFLSNEVSALIICLITLDRFLVLRFPFSSLHFRVRSAHVTCALVWLVAAAMALVPVTPVTSHWSFYSQTGICIPLPVTRDEFPGQQYAFGVLIVFNFILFLLIAAGQAAIYVSIRANSLSRAADSTKKATDLRIARRLITVALSDFLCWFPIGLLGLLASRGVPIPGEVSVGMAILVLPLNSAMNPFLYTINVVLERRSKSRDEQLLRQLMEHVWEEEKAGDVK